MASSTSGQKANLSSSVLNMVFYLVAISSSSIQVFFFICFSLNILIRYRVGSLDPVGCCGFTDPNMLKECYIQYVEVDKKEEMLGWLDSYLEQSRRVDDLETIQCLEALQSVQRMRKREQSLKKDDKYRIEKRKQCIF
jgi:hypothetical protein